MNSAAFRRGEAFSRLDSYAPVIVEHLALITWFPEHSARKHWNAEILAFQKTLKRYDNAKKREHNFRVEDIIEALEDCIADGDDKDSILIGIEGHDVTAPDNPNWFLLQVKFKEFAELIVA